MSLNNLVPASFLAGGRRAASAISGLDQALVAAHVNLDGDALGSLAACGFMLARLERKFALYSSTGVPHNLRFLALPGPVYTSLADLPFEPQAAIYLDCSEPFRLGAELAQRVSDWPSVNIDHHLAEKGMGSLCNYIDSAAAATAQLVAYTSLCLDLSLRGDLASSIALGLITDTGGFSHCNTSADVFSLCAQLLRNGCSIQELREKLENNWAPGRLRLWGRLLGRMRLEHDGEIAICGVTLADLREFQCAPEDLEGLVEWFRRVHGVLVSALVREEREGCKFSLRSRGEVDVREMAAAFGGGGHRNAAGGNTDLDLQASIAELVQVISLWLDSRS